MADSGDPTDAPDVKPATDAKVTVKIKDDSGGSVSFKVKVSRGRAGEAGWEGRKRQASATQGRGPTAEAPTSPPQRSTSFKKIAEAYATKKGQPVDAFRFNFDGDRIDTLTKTVGELDLEDGDVIDAAKIQVGGRSA